jgi:competence protein ComEA
VLCLVCLKDRPAGSAHSFASGGRSRSFDLPALPQGTLRINEAETDELIQLPGIGETLAQAILDERSVHGSFYYPEDLLAIKGIGPYRLERIVPFLNFR